MTAADTSQARIDRLILLIHNVREFDRVREGLKKREESDNNLSTNAYIQSPNSPRRPIPIMSNKVSTSFMCKSLMNHYTAFASLPDNAQKKLIAYCPNAPFRVDQQHTGQFRSLPTREEGKRITRIYPYSARQLF